MAVEQPVGAIFCDGQRCEVMVRSEVQEDGTWHNALVFRRGGRVGGRETFVTGVDWHLSPLEALPRAQAVGDMELTELFRRALRPRAPLV